MNLGTNNSQQQAPIGGMGISAPSSIAAGNSMAGNIAGNFAGSNTSSTGNLDINTLAAALQQAQKTLAASSSSNNNTNNTNNEQSQNTNGNNNNNGTPDVQAILQEMQRLRNERDEFLKNLEDEKKKSKILVEDKKKEMESFMGGIADYVNGLEGVKVSCFFSYFHIVFCN